MNKDTLHSDKRSNVMNQYLRLAGRTYLLLNRLLSLFLNDLSNNCHRINVSKTRWTHLTRYLWTKSNLSLVCMTPFSDVIASQDITYFYSKSRLFSDKLFTRSWIIMKMSKQFSRIVGVGSHLIRWSLVCHWNNSTVFHTLILSWLR